MTEKVMPEKKACRSCDAPIYWVHIVKKDGKPGRMPFDVEPAPNGTHRLVGRMSTFNNRPVMDLHATFVPLPEREEMIKAGVRLRLSHFATCPQAEQHRRGP